MLNKNEVLEALYREFLQIEQLTELSKKEDNGIVDMVVTEFRGVGKKADEVLAEMFFMPQPIADPMYEMFTISVTLEDDYKGTNKEELIKAFNFINYNLPFGAFSLDNNGEIIVLKYTALIDLDLDMENVMKLIIYSVGNMVGFAGLWIDAIFEVVNGKKTADDVKEVIGMK